MSTMPLLGGPLHGEEAHRVDIVVALRDDDSRGTYTPTTIGGFGRAVIVGLWDDADTDARNALLWEWLASDAAKTLAAGA